MVKELLNVCSTIIKSDMVAVSIGVSFNNCLASSSNSSITRWSSVNISKMRKSKFHLSYHDGIPIKETNGEGSKDDILERPLSVFLIKVRMR